jgi:DUF2905 family protein
MLPWLGKNLIAIGLIITFLGILLYISPHIPFLKFLGKLPGDISIRRENFQFYFPLTTSILLSLLLTLLLYLLRK